MDDDDDIPVRDDYADVMEGDGSQSFNESNIGKASMVMDDEYDLGTDFDEDEDEDEDIDIMGDFDEDFDDESDNFDESDEDELF